MQSCLEAQKHQQVEDKAAVTRGCVTGQHEVCAVQWCTRLYTGDSAFFSPCLGWPSPKATTKSLTFLTGAIVCRRAQRAPNAKAPPHPYLAQAVCLQIRHLLRVCLPDSQMSPLCCQTPSV